jgi:hypothetical protein
LTSNPRLFQNLANFLSLFVQPEYLPIAPRWRMGLLTRHESQRHPPGRVMRYRQ